MYWIQNLCSVQYACTKWSSVCTRDTKSHLNRPQSHIPLEHQRNFISDSSWAGLSWSVLFWIFVFKHVQFHCSVFLNWNQEIEKENNGSFIVLLFCTIVQPYSSNRLNFFGFFFTDAVAILCLSNCVHKTVFLAHFVFTHKRCSECSGAHRSVR